MRARPCKMAGPLAVLPLRCRPAVEPTALAIVGAAGSLMLRRMNRREHKRGLVRAKKHGTKSGSGARLRCCRGQSRDPARRLVYSILVFGTYALCMSKMFTLALIKPFCAVLFACLFLAGCNGHLHNGHAPPGQVKKAIIYGG